MVSFDFGTAAPASGISADGFQIKWFVGDNRWAHLDIAGPAFNSRGPYGHVTNGGTGFTVSTLVELASELAGR